MTIWCQEKRRKASICQAREEILNIMTILTNQPTHGKSDYLIAANLPLPAAPISGAWLFLIAPQGLDRIPELLGSLQVAAGESHRQGKLQFLQLVLTFRGAAQQLAARMGKPIGSSRGREGPGSVGSGVGHRLLYFYSATPGQG
jgi:hypothetical protein